MLKKTPSSLERNGMVWKKKKRTEQIWKERSRCRAASEALQWSLTYLFIRTLEDVPFFLRRIVLQITTSEKKKRRERTMMVGKEELL